MAEVALVNNRGIAFIDDADLPLVSEQRWYLHSAGYAVARGGEPLMHRFIMGEPRGEAVDHRDGNKLNNRRANLRVANYSLNTANKKVSIAKSGIQGVVLRESLKGLRYDVRIMRNYRSVCLGTYGTELEAARARLAGEIKYLGSPCLSTESWFAQRGIESDL